MFKLSYNSYYENPNKNISSANNKLENYIAPILNENPY